MRSAHNVLDFVKYIGFYLTQSTVNFELFYISVNLVKHCL